MIGTVRGVFTVVGAGAAGLLIWVSTQIGEGTTGGYWAVYGLLAGAGLTMALSQLFGGWTKWGWPKVSIGVFLIGFLPALVAAGWVLLSGQPQANWFQSHITAWSGHLAIGGLVSDLREYLGVLSFGLGLIFGFTFDTSGPTAPPFRRRVPERVEEPRPAVETLPEPEVRAPTPTTRPTREREKQHMR
jgi:hypothetical protein